MRKEGYFVISLDFELLWGVFDEVDYNEKRHYFRRTRDIIPHILKEFKKNDIHATWATVGMLFNSGWEEWAGNIPSDLPKYDRTSLSAYEFGQGIQKDNSDFLCFAPDLIRKIKDTPGQEIGTHTYSHYYCMEVGATAESFRSDLEKALEMAAAAGIELKTLIFPRNQLKANFLRICREKGIENVRSNPSQWYWKDPTSNSLMDKIGRSGDAYLNFGKKSYPLNSLEKKPGLPLEQQASRFFRPVEGNPYLRRRKLNRIKKEMSLAASQGEVYHLWWHPHNFGERSEESIKDLREILNHFSNLQRNFSFSSRNMREIGALVS